MSTGSSCGLADTFYLGWRAAGERSHGNLVEEVSTYFLPARVAERWQDIQDSKTLRARVANIVPVPVAAAASRCLEETGRENSASAEQHCAGRLGVHAKPRDEELSRGAIPRGAKQVRDGDSARQELEENLVGDV